MLSRSLGSGIVMLPLLLCGCDNRSKIVMPTTQVPPPPRPAGAGGGPAEPAVPDAEPNKKEADPNKPPADQTPPEEKK